MQQEKCGAGSTYSSYTYDSPSRIKRALHRHRYTNVLRGLTINDRTRILDFGAGDGRLFRVMIDQYGAEGPNLVAFDPSSAMAAAFTRLVPEVRFFANCAEIQVPEPGAQFDYIFCCEVFEHLTDPQIEFALQEFKRLAGPRTQFVVEVPIEIGLSGLAKNLYRRFRSGVRIPAQLMVKALFGREQVREPRRTADGNETLEHPGFSFKTTARQLSRIMTISQTFNDPFRGAPYLINNSRVFVGKLY